MRSCLRHSGFYVLPKFLPLAWLVQWLQRTAPAKAGSSIHRDWLQDVFWANICLLFVCVVLSSSLPRSLNPWWSPWLTGSWRSYLSDQQLWGLRLNKCFLHRNFPIALFLLDPLDCPWFLLVPSSVPVLPPSVDCSLCALSRSSQPLLISLLSFLPIPYCSSYSSTFSLLP